MSLIFESVTNYLLVTEAKCVKETYKYIYSHKD